MSNKKHLTLEERDSYDLFKDPAYKQMFERLPESEQKKYKNEGSYMYSKDFEVVDDLQEKLIESAAYISAGLKSGLRPSQLEKDEVNVMRQLFGKEWYKKYYFESEED
jgi:hypothetical protein